MSKPPQTLLKYCIVLFLSFFILGGQPLEFGRDKTFFHGYLIPRPIVRIGLGINLSQIKISASSGMKIYEVNSNYKLIADDADDVTIKGYKEKLSEKFVIQISQARDREEAERVTQQMKERLDREVYFTGSPDGGMEGGFKIKVGDFLTRGDALKYMAHLNQLGIRDTWILREDITHKESRPFWILVRDELKRLSDDAVLYFIPSNPQSFLSYKGRDYRGILTLKASRKGIVLFNTLNMEDYLKSVVPSELSPYDFAKLEAHKAQAVASRTYALKNLGQYEDIGFDIDDSPKSQFYKGMNAEHPLSSLAVEETQGEAALFNGKFIDALYTSTCGGMTENVEEIFLGPSLPYLRSTECAYEKQKEWRLEAKNTVSPIYVQGQNISQNIAWLISLGVIARELQPAFYREMISSAEALFWLDNACSLLGKKMERTDIPEKSSMSLGDFAKMAIHAFEWKERIENLLLDSEVSFILGKHKALDKDAKTYVAYLVQEGIISSLEDINRIDSDLSRGDFVLYLSRMIKTYQEFLSTGVFREYKQNRITFEKAGNIVRLNISPEVFLMGSHEGNTSFVEELHLLGGEELRWIEKNGELLLVEVIYPAYTNILDRSSKYHSWKVRRSREELSQRLNQFFPLGELVDIIPQKRGVSNRVTELQIVGSESQAVVKGLRIRRTIGLRETLFVIDREFGTDGRISHFVFKGRGWGHGVGLCQVGAYGMAQAGADYKDILEKYYHGIKIGKVY